MAEVYHIDLSNKFWKRKTTGIACVSADNKQHIGCGLSMRLKKDIYRYLIMEESPEARAKLYAICIYYLVKSRINCISKLVICNDENFKLVKLYLAHLLGNAGFDIVSITDYRKELGRSIKSPADNFAAHYAKRGLSERKQSIGIKLNAIKISLKLIRMKWREIKDVSE